MMFYNVETDKVYRIDNVRNRVVRQEGEKWVRSNRYRPADLSGYPFIGVTQHFLLKRVDNVLAQYTHTN